MRLSFGGGGTELSPYVDKNGGCVLSSAIGLYATALFGINPRNKGVTLNSQESSITEYFDDIKSFDLTNGHSSLRLSIACIQYFIDAFAISMPRGLTLTTGSDAPIGSGLGASSVLTVAIVGGLQFLFGLNFKKNEIINVAQKIERELLGLSGGLQDHYPAVYGGLNFIDFNMKKEATVQPIDLDSGDLSYLEASLLLVYSGQSRSGAKIIDQQTKSVAAQENSSIQNFHDLRLIAEEMRISLSRLDLPTFGSLLDKSWKLKKATSPEVTNEKIDFLYNLAKSLGAYGGKVSGAGGGGFMIFLVPPDRKITIAESILTPDTILFPTNLVSTGLRIKNISSKALNAKFLSGDLLL
jgi:D-glycero-alpha-D-manno-heptose-7-phosphate kinase